VLHVHVQKLAVAAEAALYTCVAIHFMQLYMQLPADHNDTKTSKKKL
jgi:hypothetical protein